MGATKQYRYQRAIGGLGKVIPIQLKGFDEEHHPLGKSDSVSHYADALEHLVFDTIESAIFWADKIDDLEAFRDHIQGAIDSLDIAIEVWKRSEEKDSGSSTITLQHH